MPSKTKSIRATTALLSTAVLIVWLFPRFWYTKTDPRQGHFWLAEQTELPGWQYQERPVSQAAEAVLAADKIINGEFRNERGAAIRVFSAKSYVDEESEFNMFSHTPDRCWTSVGWKLEPTAPEFVEISLHGIPLLMERRIFVDGPRRELVYFGALVGGQPLPYRLDQYRTIAVRRTAKAPAGIFGKMLGTIDARFFSWPWKAFVNRRPLSGPKQFIRISTSVLGNDAQDAERLLTDFLPHWLVPVDYRLELGQWRRR